jgi:CHAT domain-containing protein
MLRGNKTPAAALRGAQIEMLRSGPWRSPYYWAAFVMQGEWN